MTAVNWCSIAIIGALMSCQNSNAKLEPYPAKIKSTFIEGCGKDYEEFCTCTIDGIEKRVPFSQFVDNLRKHKDRFMYERPYIDVALACSPSYKKLKNPQ